MKISKEKHLNNAGKLSVGVIIAMAAVAVVALIFIAGGGFSKTVHKTFDSPKKYFSYVEKQAILGKKDSSVLSRVNDASEFYTNTDRYLKEEITLTVGEKGGSYLRLLKETGVDLSWLTSAGIAYTVNSKDNNLEVKSTITLNEKEIISPEVILDSQKKAIYAKIPELAKDYAKYDLEEYGEKFDEFLEMAEKMKAAYPDSKDMKKLLTKYVKLVLDNVENVERTRGAVLECDEVSQKCTLLTVTLKEEDFLKILAMEIPFTAEEFEGIQREELCERAFQEAMASFKRKTERIQATAWPIIQQVYENQGAMYERIMVPITDGKRMYNIPCNLKEAYDTEAKSVVKQWEKVIMLHIIDDDWKENLRQLDELRHSVQNASYEQKDPLLIFKLESVKLWDSMINEMNDRIASILMRGQIPVMEQEQPVQEAAPEQRPKQNYVEQKVDIDAERERAERAAQQVNHTPYRAERMPRPNDPCPCGSGKKFKNCHGRNL